MSYSCVFFVLWVFMVVVGSVISVFMMILYCGSVFGFCFLFLFLVLCLFGFIFGGKFIMIMMNLIGIFIIVWVIGVIGLCLFL